MDSFNTRVLTVSEPLARSFRAGDLSSIDSAALHSFEEAGLVTQPTTDLKDEVYTNMDQAAADVSSPVFVLLPASRTATWAATTAGKCVCVEG